MFQNLSQLIPSRKTYTKGDAANNYVRGHYTQGKADLDRVLDQVRKLVDQTFSLASFFIYHLIGGGIDLVSHHYYWKDHQLIMTRNPNLISV